MKKARKKQDKNIMSASAMQGGRNKEVMICNSNSSEYCVFDESVLF